MSEQIVDISPHLNNLYKTDFVRWVDTTAQLLREGRFTELDLENLVEEVESLGKRDKREMLNRLIKLLSHLLKYSYQSQKRSTSWISTINEQRRQILLILNDSPSLKNYLLEVFAECYAKARNEAARETNLTQNTFPECCPFSQDDVLREDWFPK
jgi:hypothetical protein